MNIAVYFTPLWGVTRTPTGVGKHIAHMAEELCRADGVKSVTLMANRRAYQDQVKEFPNSLRVLPVHYVPGSEGWMRRVQMATRLVPLDRWANGADWIYCPKEQPVAVRRARLAVTVHDLLSFEPAVGGLRRNTLRSSLFWRATMSRVLSRADLIATVSTFTRDRLIEIFKLKDSDRIVVVGNGADSVFYRTPASGDGAVLAKYGVQSREYLLAVGGLNLRKGGDLLLKIGESLKRTAPGLSILVCGLSHERQLFRQLQEHQRDDPRYPVRLCGYVADEELAALYTHAAALLFPSRYEGFGIPMIEAMAAGAPVVCSDSSALPETGGGAVCVMTTWDVQAWVSTIRELCRSNGQRAELIARGHDRAAQMTWSHCASRLLNAMGKF